MDTDINQKECSTHQLRSQGKNSLCKFSELSVIRTKNLCMHTGLISQSFNHIVIQCNKLWALLKHNNIYCVYEKYRKFNCFPSINWHTCLVLPSLSQVSAWQASAGALGEVRPGDPCHGLRPSGSMSSDDRRPSVPNQSVSTSRGTYLIPRPSQKRYTLNLKLLS